MIYKLNWDNTDGVFAVPDKAVDECIKLANGKSAKLLLYIARRKTADLTQADKIAEEIGISREDVEDAFSFWEQVGILCKSAVSENKIAISAVAVTAEKDDLPQNIKAVPKITAQRGLSKATKMLTPKEISECIEGSDELKFLFSETEGLFGRLLNNTEQRSLIWMRDYYSIPADLLLMIIGYCKSINKLNMSYIEAIAADWDKKGIASHDAADNEIMRLQSSHTLASQVASGFGIKRALGTSELAYIKKWAEMGIDMPLISYAYEKSVAATKSNKLEFSYINAILTKWAEKNIHTVAEADALDKKPDLKQQTPSDSHSYDLGLILEHAMKNTPKINKE